MKASMPASAKAAMVPFGMATTVAPAGDGVAEVLLGVVELVEAKESRYQPACVGKSGECQEDPLVRDERLEASDGQ